MKYYFHTAYIKESKEGKKIEASVSTHNTLDDALKEYGEYMNLTGPTGVRSIKSNGRICFISTSGEIVKYKLDKTIKVFGGTSFECDFISYKFKAPLKYECCRTYLETDTEYGYSNETFTVLYTNYKKSVAEFEKNFKKIHKGSKRDSYKILGL